MSRFDEILDRIRSEEPDRVAMGEAASHVRAKLGIGAVGEGDSPLRGQSPGQSPMSWDPRHIESCAGFRALVPAYLLGSLPQRTALLFEDHSRECVPCRRALVEARSARASAPGSEAGALRFTARVPRAARSWGLAAAVVLGLLLAGYLARGPVLDLLSSPTLEVLAADGGLYRISAGGTAPVAVGSTIREGDVIRTGREGDALVRLSDGSRIEMRERTELSVIGRRDGSTVSLAMGGIIVEASPQGQGHLGVRAGDCLVSVKGTIFAVHHGTKGSLVGVLEGAVRVERAGESHLLRPGEQLATSESLAPPPVQDLIGWSRDLDRYLELLNELKVLRRDLDRAVPSQPPRHSTRLLDLAPGGTVLYAAIPNVSSALSDASRLLRERIEQSEALREWWTSRMGAGGGEELLESAVERVHEIGSHLGDEVVVTIQMKGDRIRGLLVMAEVRDPEALSAALEREAPKAARELPLRIEGDLLLAGPDPSVALGGLRGTPFHARIAQEYRDGAGWLVAADLKAMLGAPLRGRPAAEGGQRHVAALDRMGVLDAEYLVAEREEEGGRTRHRAVLSFDQPRRGLVSWLAEPSPMGSLGFVSPEASLAAAFVVKSPATLVRDLYGFLESVDPDFGRHLEAFRADTGLDPAADLAEPLGSDFALALDGPVLPLPSWKLVVEVYDPAGLEAGIERIVERINREGRERGLGDPVVIQSQTVGGRVFRTVRFQPSALELHYTFAGGYLLAAPSRALLLRSIQQREAGQSLPASATFASLLPRDGETDFSALVYENLGRVIAPLARQADEAAGGLTGEQERALAAAASDIEPRLAYIYAERDRIVLATDEVGGLGSDLAALLGIHGSADLHRLVGQAIRRQAERAGEAAREGSEVPDGSGNDR